MARACLVPADETFATVITPSSVTFLDANGRLVRSKIGVIAMDADEVTSEVVLTTEGAATGGVGADMRLQAIGVVSSHVRLEIVCASEGARARRTFVFLARVTLGVLTGLRNVRLDHVGDVGGANSGLGNGRVETQSAVQV